MTINIEDAQTLHRQGNLETARKMYLSHLKKHPKDANILHAMGMLNAQLGEFDEAIQYFNKAILEDKNNPIIYLNLGNSYKAKNDLTSAKKVLLQAIELNPAYASALNNLGTVFFSENHFEEAITYFQKAIAVQSDYLEALYNLGLSFLKLSELDKAKNSFEKIISLSPTHPGALFQIGRINLSKQDFAQAEKYFLIIEENFPFHLETQTNLATCYLQQGALKSAKTHYLKALDIKKDDTQILFNLGVVTSQLGDLDAAIQYYQRALQHDKNFFAAHNNLGVAFLNKHHPGFALHHFREALKLQPENKAIEYTVQMLAQDERLLASPPEYIKNLFDTYADHYDFHLQKGLAYKIPNIFLNLVQKFSPEEKLNILDLGCGTGLCAQILKPYANKIIGVDLSKNMLAHAKEKNIYDDLIENDFLNYLKETTQQFDLILAGDVFVYIGELKEIFSSIKKCLNPNGLWIFNTEVTDEKDYRMNQSGRFSHQHEYIERLAKQNHFMIKHSEKIISRQQNGDGVQGYVYVLMNL